MRSSHLTFLPLFLVVACSQAPTGSDPTGAPASSTSTLLAAATGGPGTGGDEDDDVVPREKFADPEKNFEAAKQALLTGYYRDSLTEGDLYRAAVSGMVQRADQIKHRRFTGTRRPHQRRHASRVCVK